MLWVYVVIKKNNNGPQSIPIATKAIFHQNPHLHDPREGAVFFSKEFLRQNLGQGNLKGQLLVCFMGIKGLLRDHVMVVNHP